MRYDGEGGTGWGTYLGEKMRMTVLQLWDGRRRFEEREGDQRQLGEGLSRRRVNIFEYIQVFFP